jgi:hypothetical protein
VGGYANSRNIALSAPRILIKWENLTGQTAADFSPNPARPWMKKLLDYPFKTPNSRIHPVPSPRIDNGNKKRNASALVKAA